MTALHDAHITADTSAKEKPVVSPYNFFDPLDAIEAVQHPLLKAMILSSATWYIDTLCINKARDIFYRVRETVEADGGIDEFNEFISAIAEIKGNEQYSEEQGFEQNAGAMQELALLTGIRLHWHDVSDTAAGAAKIKNEVKSFEQLIASEKVRTVDDETRSNLEACAAFAARGASPERAKLIAEQLEKEQAARFAHQHKQRQLVAPAVINIITLAEYRRAGDESAQFHQLALDTQRRLIAGVRAAVMRAMNTLATWRLPVGEYATSVLPDGYACVDELDAVLTSPKFN